MKRGKQRSGSEHLSLSSGTSPDAFIRFGLLGELQLPTVISIKLRHKAGASAGAGERRGDHAVRVRQPRHRQRGLRPPSRHARLEDGSRGAAGFGAAAAPRGGFGRAKTKGSERRAAGSLRPQRPPPAAGAPLFRSRTGTAEAGGHPARGAAAALGRRPSTRPKTGRNRVGAAAHTRPERPPAGPGLRREGPGAQPAAGAPGSDAQHRTAPRRTAHRDAAPTRTAPQQTKRAAAIGPFGPRSGAARAARPMGCRRCKAAAIRRAARGGERRGAAEERGGMAPSFRHGKGRAPRGGSGGADRRVSGGRGAERGGWGARADGAVCPQARKPLVEKKRRARLNESLRELRRLLAGGEVRSGEGGGGRGRRRR